MTNADDEDFDYTAIGPEAWMSEEERKSLRKLEEAEKERVSKEREKRKLVRERAIAPHKHRIPSHKKRKRLKRSRIPATMPTTKSYGRISPNYKAIRKARQYIGLASRARASIEESRLCPPFVKAFTTESWDLSTAVTGTSDTGEPLGEFSQGKERAYCQDIDAVIAEGEALQLLNCGDPETTEGQYLAVIRSKTAKLFEAACQIGAVLAQTSRVDEEAIARYGMHVGTAFQLIDDVLDYRGSTDEIGKNLGDDLAEGKPTLPLIYVIKNGDEAQQALVRNAITNGGLDDIEAVVSAVESSGAITYTARAAAAEAELAVKAIEGIPTSPYRDALEGLAEFAVSRTH